MKNFCSTVHLMVFLFIGFSFLAQAQNSIGIIGNAADVTANPSGGALLMGGAGDNDDAMRWMLEKSDGGDIVILRATGTDAYNEYLFNLGPAVNSVQTLLINSRNKANNTANETIIRNAEAVFIAGGDQYDYVSNWKDTRVEDALNYLINTKGVVVGGTSAGCAIQGQTYFDAANGTVTSLEVLADPYDTNVSLQRDNFINHPILANTITDTHYDNPDRRGRHTGFLARMVEDWGVAARGIGVDEYTAVCVEPNGIAKVFGDQAYQDYAYFLQSYSDAPEVCTAGSRLTWDSNGEAVKVYKIRGRTNGSGTFDLNDWASGNGGIWQNFYVTNGAFQVTSPSSPPNDGGTDDYCDSSGDSSSEFIKRFSIGSLDNSSGDDGGYADNTGSIAATLRPGINKTVRMVAGFTGDTHSEYFEIYIDLNQDGEFDASEESVFSGFSNNGQRLAGTINLPASALDGTTRMRVSMSRDDYPGPCESIVDGEVEDYTVKINNNMNARIPTASSTTKIDVSIYPNPTKEFLYVRTAYDGKAQVTIVDLSGKILVARSFTGEERIELKGWSQGIYFVEVTDGFTAVKEKIIVVE